MIFFENVTKKFPNGTVALNKVSFHVEPGEFLFLVGPSGAGKTSVLRLLLRELIPTQGKILIEGKDLNKLKSKHLPQLRRQIGAVFQDYKLIEDRTIRENVALVSEMVKQSNQEIRRHVEKILELVNLKDKADLFPSQLSGGELQRTAIARALATKPKIIFADEPTGNLDRSTAWEVIKVLATINKGGTTVIIASHNQEFTQAFDKRIIELKQGRVVRDTKKPKTEKKRAKAKISKSTAGKKPKSKPKSKTADDN